jgi:hypothetical protein
MTVTATKIDSSNKSDKNFITGVRVDKPNRETIDESGFVIDCPDAGL